MKPDSSFSRTTSSFSFSLLVLFLYLILFLLPLSTHSFFSYAMATPSKNEQKVEQLPEQSTPDNQRDTTKNIPNNEEELFVIYPNKRVPLSQISRPHSRPVGSSPQPNNAGGLLFNSGHRPSVDTQEE